MRSIAIAVLVNTLLPAADEVVDMFNDTVVHEIKLTVNPSDWKTLRDNYLDDTYYECALE